LDHRNASGSVGAVGAASAPNRSERLTIETAINAINDMCVVTASACVTGEQMITYVVV